MNYPEYPKCDLCNRRLTEDFEVEIGICEECCEKTGCEDKAVVETMFGETHYYCPYCNSECPPDYCFVCKSKLAKP